MSRRTAYAHVEVSLDEFSDDDLLEELADRKVGEAPRDEREEWLETLSRIRTELVRFNDRMEALLLIDRATVLISKALAPQKRKRAA